MTQRVIDPSEIIVEKVGAPRENITHVNPWIRLLSRFFDYALFCLTLLSVEKYTGWHLFSSSWISIEFLLFVPVETLLLATWGTTPGKWIFKTTLRHKHQHKLDFPTALRRSFAVWLRGMGLGVPVLNAICMLASYNRLRLRKITSWDAEEEIRVTHYPLPKWRLPFALFIAFGGLLFYYSVIQ